LDYTRLAGGREDEQPLWGGLTAGAWVKIGIVTALLVALFRFNLARLWGKAAPFIGDPNWQHSFLIPIVGVYFLYLNRDRLLAARVKPIFFERFTRTRLIVAGAAIVGGGILYAASITFLGSILSSDILGAFAGTFGIAAAVWGMFMLVLGWGIGNLVFGLLTFAYGIYPGRNDWVSDFGMVHTIFGTVLTLCGWEVMRVVWFPIAFLLCALPWPGLVYSWIANPLQHFAAMVTVKVLNVTGISAARSGTKMFVFNARGEPHALNVAEACAGLKSLMTFISAAAAIAFLSQRAFWQKLIITASAVPIAIFCNVMRVTGQAYLDRLAGQQWSEGFAHQFVGIVMFIPAFFLILLVAWIVDQLFVEEVDDKAKLKAAIAARRAAGAATAAPADAPTKIIAAPRKPAPATAPAPVAVQVASKPAEPAAPPKPASPTPPPKPAAAPAVRLPPRTNLTGRPASPPGAPARKPAPPTNNRPAEGR
jgi:exosortase